ncbi:hypothetical protein E4U41_007576, partial [Claviceps citrina]
QDAWAGGGGGGGGRGGGSGNRSTGRCCCCCCCRCRRGRHPVSLVRDRHAEEVAAWVFADQPLAEQGRI